MRRNALVDMSGYFERASKTLVAWLDGVTLESFQQAIKRLLDEKVAIGEYRFRDEGELAVAAKHAEEFFSDYAQKIVVLSDDRCVYFAPDARARDRNHGDLSRCWAEYAIHAITSGGAKFLNQGFNERWFNRHKVNGLPLLEGILKKEQCVIRLRDNYRYDSILFVGGELAGVHYQIVTRLDEMGNLEANLTEVTFEAITKRQKKTPQLVSLAEAVQAVVHHQIATGSNPSDMDRIPRMGFSVKGESRFSTSGKTFACCNANVARKALHIMYTYGTQGVGGAAAAATRLHLDMVDRGVDSRVVCVWGGESKWEWEKGVRAGLRRVLCLRTRLWWLGVRVLHAVTRRWV